MKTAIITDLFLGEFKQFKNLKNLLSGGAEVYQFELANRVLKPLFSQVDIFQFHGQPAILDKKIAVKNISSAQEINVRDYDLIILNNGFHCKNIFRALRHLKKEKYAGKIVILHHGIIIRPAFSFTFAKRIGRLFLSEKSLKNYFRFLLELLKWGPSRFLTIQRLNKITKKVDAVLSVDFDSIRYVNQKQKPKWQAIVNFVDTDVFCPKRRAAIPSQILVPRNLRYERGVDIVLELTKCLKTYYAKPFCFVLAGTGPLKNYLEKRIQKDNLSSYIKLIGHQDHFKDLPRLMNESEIVLIPTYSDEGTSLSALEAMACAKPVVMTNVGGLNDIGEHLVNKLSSQFNARSIAKNILLFLNNKSLAKLLAEQARTYVMKNNSINLWTKQWKDFLKQTLI